MKIVSWNCNYGLDEEKFKKIVNDEKFGNADIYAFQEVLENEFIDIADYEKADEYNYRHWYGDHQEYGECHIPRGAEGDLGIVLISKTYKIQRFDQGRIKFRYVVPYILTNKNDKDEKFILIHVWTKGKPDGYIKPIYDALEFYKEQFTYKGIEKIIMLGDFNFGINLNNKGQYGEDDLKRIEKKINGFVNGLVRDEDRFKLVETFYARNGNHYFNDCIYTKNVDLKTIEIGKKEEWIDDDKNLSDHCPIMAEIETK